MSVSIFDPKTIEVGPIGDLMASKVKNEGLKAFFAAKSADGGDGNLSSIVIGDSENMGIGVGTWAAGQYTKQPIPVMFDEAIFIVEGTLQISCNGQERSASVGQCVHIAAGSLVDFASADGCRLVWVTSPPTWKAIEAAWEAGLIKKPE